MFPEPNWKPCVSGILGVEEPNLKPELVEIELALVVDVTPNLNPPPGAIDPKDFTGEASFLLALLPGLGVSQHTHFSTSGSFPTMQVLFNNK